MKHSGSEVPAASDWMIATVCGLAGCGAAGDGRNERDRCLICDRFNASNLRNSCDVLSPVADGSITSTFPAATSGCSCILRTVNPNVGKPKEEEQGRLVETLV